MSPYISTNRVRIRITFKLSEMRLLEKAAEKQGVTVPQFITDAALDAAEYEMEER